MNRFPHPPFIPPDDFLDRPSPPASIKDSGAESTPWRLVTSYNRTTSVILSAEGKTLFIGPTHTCERVVNAVNAMYPGGRSPF